MGGEGKTELPPEINGIVKSAATIPVPSKRTAASIATADEKRAWGLIDISVIICFFDSTGLTSPRRTSLTLKILRPLRAALPRTEVTLELRSGCLPAGP